MTTRTLPTVLAGIGVALAVAEVISFVQISQRGGPDDFPLFALVFGALFVLGAWLLRTGRVITGTVLVAVLAAFEVVDYPSWTKHGTFDWIVDTTIAVVALAGICLAAIVLITRRSVLRAQAAPGRNAPRTSV